MSNYTKKDSFFNIKYFTNFLFDQYQPENISILARMIDFAFDNIELPFLDNIVQSNSKIGGRPALNYVGCIKAYFLLICRGLPLRDLIKVATPGSEYMYLLGEQNIIPKAATLTKVAKIIDENIDLIFESVINLIKKEIDLDESKLYCDGTIYEAHNSRNKVITKHNTSKGIKRWTNKLASDDLSYEERKIATQKLAKWQERNEILSNLDRNSYGLTDFECILVKDKNGSFIAGYNVQLIEEANYGLIVYAYATNKTPDLNALRATLDEVLLKFKPKYFIVDTGYDAPDIIERCKDHNVQIVVKSRKENNLERIINELSFELNEAEDELICPNNKSLKATKINYKNTNHDMKFICKECEGCSFSSMCKPKDNIKTITLNLKEFKNLKELKGYMETDESKEIYSHRANLCESPHGFMKHYLKGKKFKRNGLIAANTTIKILALAFNLVRLYNIKK